MNVDGINPQGNMNFKANLLARNVCVTPRMKQIVQTIGTDKDVIVIASNGGKQCFIAPIVNGLKENSLFCDDKTGAIEKCLKEIAQYFRGTKKA